MPITLADDCINAKLFLAVVREKLANDLIQTRADGDIRKLVKLKTVENVCLVTMDDF